MTTPPGWTCPAIDKAKHHARRLRWRLARPEYHDSLPSVLRDLDQALEQVRAENRQMRAAWHDMRARAAATNTEPPPTRHPEE